jgi:hypothetical protein
MSKAMDVPAIRRKSGSDGVAGEQSLDLALPETALTADEEGYVVVSSGPEVGSEERDKAFEERLLAAVPVFHSPDADRPPL